MRRLFSILLLSLLTLNFFGGYFYFFVRTLQIKKEMRAAIRQLPHEKLEKHFLTENGFNRAKVDDHEIKVNGKMYDIARIEKAGDKIVVFCLHDKDEDSLIGFLDKVVIRLQNDDTQPPLAITNFSLLQFIPVAFDLQFSAPESFITPMTPYTNPHFFYSLTLDTPPPRA